MSKYIGHLDGYLYVCVLGQALAVSVVVTERGAIATEIALNGTIAARDGKAAMRGTARTKSPNEALAESRGSVMEGAETSRTR